MTFSLLSWIPCLVLDGVLYSESWKAFAKSLFLCF